MKLMFKNSFCKSAKQRSLLESAGHLPLENRRDSSMQVLKKLAYLAGIYLTPSLNLCPYRCLWIWGL